MSQLMFWNKQNNSNNNNTNNHANGTNVGGNGASSLSDGKNGKRNWLHAPDALVNGHVVYLVKFFGNLSVEQAKGIEVVKDAIRKLQFAQQMKKAETGTQEKFKKVEITISVDGVAVQEPRSQKILHQFPLHNISYCADEKGVKKFFSFIAKTTKTAGDTNNHASTTNTTTSDATDSHECFVFISNKLASDITLTIGQAFDLAYRKYISSTEKTDLGKAQQQISELEKNLTTYRNRLREVSLKLPKAELETLLFKMGIKDILELPQGENTAMITNGNSGTAKASTNNDTEKLLIDTASTKSSSSSSYVPIVPPRNNLSSQIMHKSNSQKMDELLLNSDTDSDFDPRADESAVDGSNGRNDSNDLFGFEPLKSYGQLLFHNNNDTNKNTNNNNKNVINNNTSSNSVLNNSNNMNINNTSFNNEVNSVPPPLLAPPPKVSAPRRSTSVTNNITNGNTDLFGSDPFEMNGPSMFKSKLNSVSVDDFSLESLDPLRK